MIIEEEELLLLGLKFFLDLLDIDSLHYRLEILILQSGPSACCFRLVLAVFPLKSGNRHDFLDF